MAHLEGNVGQSIVDSFLVLKSARCAYCQAAELAKARQRADVAIEELARLRKDSFTHQESTEEIAALRQREAGPAPKLASAQEGG